MEQNVILQFELVAGIQSHVFYFSLCIILSFQLKHKNATINKLLRCRRMECSVCGHTWFQSRERLMTLEDGFEMVPLPDRDMDRIQQNIKEGRHPKYYGDFKMYVGNISFQCSEEDLTEFFETIGPVGDVSLVLDNETGRPRGFGFVTMRNKADGERAIEELDGKDLKGRNLNVRPSNN